MSLFRRREAPIPQSEWSQPDWQNPYLYGGDTGVPVPPSEPPPPPAWEPPPPPAWELEPAPQPPLRRFPKPDFPLPHIPPQGPPPPSAPAPPTPSPPGGPVPQGVEGVDPNKWAAGHSSPKYDTLRILSKYPHTAEGLRAAAPELAARGIKVTGDDSIDFPGIGIIDVIRAVHGNQGGASWQWIPPPPPGGGIPPPPPVVASRSSLPVAASRRSLPIEAVGPPGLPIEAVEPPGHVDLGGLRALGASVAEPGSSGVYKGPTQQVSQDPLSQIISGSLGDFIGRGGQTPFGEEIGATLKGLIERGGHLPGDEAATNLKYEKAREMSARAQRSMVTDLRNELASRNLLSIPGIEQGPEISSIRRTTEAIAPEFASAIRDIMIGDQQTADTRLSQALTLATGMGQSQAQNFLGAVGSGTQRQAMLSDIALRSLEDNMAWNQFLANFGLERDKVMAELQNGNIMQLMPLLQMFFQLVQSTAGGYIGSTEALGG